MNIVIINQPLNNRGDEAAHRSLIRNLNKAFPNANISVVFIQRNLDSIEQMRVKFPRNEYVNITGTRGIYRLSLFLMKYNLLGLAVFYPPFNKFIKRLKKTDVIINAPGGICMGGFQNWKHILYISLALKYNKNVFYYSRSIGPFPETTNNNRIFKRKSIGILQKLKFISLRDNQSIKTASLLGINCIHAIDTAFLDIPSVNLPSELENITTGNYIVFVPNSLTWQYAYKNAKQEMIDNCYISIIKIILDRTPNFRIIMLPQLFNDQMKSDEQYFHYLQSKVNDERITVMPEVYSSDIQQKIISKSKIVVGARYHSIVFAINNNVPFIALSYEHKIIGLLELLDINKFCIDITEIGECALKNQSILTQFIDLLNTDLSYTHDVREKANNIAKYCFEEVVKSLNHI
jgi:colanic acid/amylovoran biosynthesis protein